MRRSFRLLAGAVVAATLALTGCSNSSSSSSSAAGSGGADGGTLVVYTNSNSDGRGDYLTAEAKKAGFDIKIVGLGGGELTNKLLAEKANPVADVTFGLNNMYFSNLKSNGILVPYTPAWSSKVDAKLGDSDSDKAYWPLVQQAIVLAYDSSKWDTSKAPTDWTDLGTKPQFKGQYQTETSLAGATTQLVLAGILTRYQDPKGQLGVSAEGWNQIKQFFANGSPAKANTDLYARMKNGELVAGQMWSSGIPGFEKKYGITTGIMQPSVGVPYAIEQVGIVKGTKKMDQAKKFIDWFGSEATQSAWSAKFSSMPVNQDSIAKADPSIVQRHTALKHQDIDWAFASKNMNAWVEKIQLEYMK